MSGSRGIAVVTGGAGFIGSHMVDLLVEESFRVHVLDNLTDGRLLNLDHHRSNTEVIFEKRYLQSRRRRPVVSRGEICISFCRIGDIVPSIERPMDYMSTNLLGTVRVLEAARHAGIQKRQLWSRQRASDSRGGVTSDSL